MNIFYGAEFLISTPLQQHDFGSYILYLCALRNAHVPCHKANVMFEHNGK